MLSTGLAFVLRYRDRLPDDVTIRERVAMLARRLANIERLTGGHDRAEALYAEAVARFRELAEEVPDREEAFGNLLNETRTDWAESRRMAGRDADAARLFAEVVADAHRRAAARPEDGGLARTEAQARYSLALALRDIGRLDEARDHFRRTFAQYGPLAEASRAAITPPAEAADVGALQNALQDQLVLILVLRSWASADRLAGRPAEAEGRYERADALIAEVRRRFGGSFANLDVFDAQLDVELGRRLADDPGRRDEAAARLDDAVAAFEELLEAGRSIPHYREGLADARSARGRLAALRGQPAPARDDAERARELLDALIAESPAVPSYKSLLGEAAETLGRAAALDGDLDGARDWFRRAIEAQGEALAINPDHPDYARRLESHREAAAAAGTGRPPDQTEGSP